MQHIDLDAHEQAYYLNFLSHEKDLVDFTQSSWNLTSLFLFQLDGLKNLKPKQKVCIYMLGKSRRLLKTISTLVFLGYWPEAEILFRALFETHMLLAYILRDETDKRANTWLNRTKAKERWQMAEILKEIDGSFGVAYTNLSLYPHSHIISVMKYIEINEDSTFKISHGPLGGEENNLKAAKVLGSAAMTNAALCEMSVPYFNLPPSWQEAHIKLMELPHFQNQLPTIHELMSNEENIERVKRFLTKK